MSTLRILAVLTLAVSPLFANVSLRVALYPYLPDSYKDNYKTLETRIKQEFEALYPDVDLYLRPLSAQGDFYDKSELLKLLETHDVVEVDSIFIGDLIAEPEAVAPWIYPPCNQTDWQPMPREACTQGCTNPEICYAYPHWQCAYFLFSNADKLGAISDVPSFLEALEQSLKSGTPLPLAFLFSGSHTIAEIFMDAWSDAGDNPAPWETLYRNATLTEEALQNLANISGYACTPGGKQPGRGGIFSDYPTLPEAAYDLHLSDYFIGYSENYYYISENQPMRNTSAIHTPWGTHDNPNLAVDVFLLSARSNTTQAYYAQKFVEYITSPETFEWIVLSEDIPENAMTPRYLLPSTLSAFLETSIADNAMMQNYLKVLSSPTTSLLPTHFYADFVYKIANQTNAFLDANVECQ